MGLEIFEGETQMNPHIMKKAELNISYCTFKEEDINALIEVIEEEKRKAADELRRIYEELSSENEADVEDENEHGEQWKVEMLRKLKALEGKAIKSNSKVNIFDAQVNLSFTVSAGKRTLSGSDWAELFGEFREPVNSIVVKFDCPDLKRKITLKIREHYGILETYRNRYEIKGFDAEWINEAAAALDSIILRCKNKRENWYEINSFLEPAFSIVLAGSIFLSLRIFALALHQNFFSTFNEDVTIYLSGMLLYIFIWIFLAAGLTMKLFEYIRGVYPSIEIYLNEERIKKRKKLYYIATVVIVPYVLSLYEKLSR